MGSSALEYKKGWRALLDFHKLFFAAEAYYSPTEQMKCLQSTVETFADSVWHLESKGIYRQLLHS